MNSTIERKVNELALNKFSVKSGAIVSAISLKLGQLNSIMNI